MPHSGGNTAAVVCLAMNLLPIMLLGLRLFGRPAGRTASLLLAAATIGGRLADPDPAHRGARRLVDGPVLRPYQTEYG